MSSSSTVAESRPSAASSTSAGEDHSVQPMLRTPQPPRPTLSLVRPSGRHRPRPGRLARMVRCAFRKLPVFNPKCKPCKPLAGHGHYSSVSAFPGDSRRNIAGIRVTGTLFGFRKGIISLCLQETPRCLPTLVVELAMQTQVLLREMTTGMMRIALETEKKPDKDRSASPLLDEPIWSMFCNGKKHGFAVRREPTDDDLAVMELLRAVSMGAGVLPGRSETEGPDGEMAYMRAYFDHVVASRDSQTLYMMSPDGNNGPELTVFFVRI